MSTYPVEFSQLETENKKLKQQRDALRTALEGIIWYAVNRHMDIHIESYRKAIKIAKFALTKTAS